MELLTKQIRQHKSYKDLSEPERKMLSVLALFTKKVKKDEKKNKKLAVKKAEEAK